MNKKLFCSILFFPYFLFSQTFTNNIVEPAGNWNATLTRTITVSGLPILQTGVFELNQVNLHLGDDSNSRNYNSYRVTLQKGSVVIDLVAVGGFPNSTIRQINTKFRYNTVLRRLFEHGGTTEPFHIGYYRSQDDFSLFNGFDPNGDWTITITETSFATGGRFNSIELKFGAPLQINNQTLNTSYDSCSTPLCISSDEITIATNNGLTAESIDMFNGNTSSCSWNAAQNNSAWFKFVASQSTAKITISGISGNIQILAVSPGIDNNICTPIDNTLINGGCPEDLINDSYFSPQYLNGSTRNNQLNLSGLNVGQEYYFIVDGTGGAISPFYIELEGVNQSCNCFVDVPLVLNQPPSCLSPGTSTIINYDSSNSYIFSPATPGISISSSGFISGMIIGTNYTVSASNGSCASANSSSFAIAAQLVTPAVPTITTTAPTCLANGFSQISNYVGGTTYTFTPAGPTVDGTGMITGMTLGTSYTVTATVGSCTSASSASFTNLAQLTVPTVPTVSVTAPTCSANGFATITNYLAGLTYVFTPVGPTVDGTGLISGMTIGTNYTVSASNGSCASSDSSSFTIAAMLTTPAVPTITTTAPTCLANGFSQISNYVGGTTYTFTPAGPTVDGTGMITGMTLGTSYTVTATVGSCTSSSSASFTNLAQLTVPTVPTVSVTAPTCSANGFATITNYLAGLTYVFTPVGPTVDGTGLISGMTIGTNYTVSASNGSCASSDSSSFTIAAMLNTPAIATASVTLQPTCPNPSGTIVVTAPLGGSLEYSIDNGITYQTSPTFSGLAPDSSYTIIVRNTSSGCTSSASPNIIINSVPPSPVVSTVSGCNGARFEVTASVDSGVATYEWYDSSSNLLGTTATVAISQSGTYEVRATVDSCTTIEFITIQVLPCTIPKGISPNNDGDNDVWDLSGLNVQKAQIFNRYGVEVYSRSNYTNEWDGRTNSGDELPTATYYYVLSLPNGEVKTGWVYLVTMN